MPDYADFIATTGYKQPGGLCGFNCRHGFHPFDPKYDKPTYTAEQLKQLNETQVRIPGGEQVPLYKATQMQRAMERNLRKTKQELEMAETVQNEKLTGALKTQVRLQQRHLREFCDATGLPRQYFRESVDG